MSLPFPPPIPQMLAKSVGEGVPAPDSVPGGLRYDPKWDGFRVLIFHDTTDEGSSVVLQGRYSTRSRSAKDLAYAFPEVVSAVTQLVPPGSVVDGELVIARNGRLHFDDLGMRLRPRSEEGGWKIRELSQDFPASVVAFDLLAVGGQDFRGLADRERRSALEGLLDGVPAPIHLSPTTTDQDTAREWFHLFEGAGLDGVIARSLASAYMEGKRTLLKVKHKRSADVVVAGWRPHKNPGPDGQPVVGSLLLGLYDNDGQLHHVGVASSFTAERRIGLLQEIAPVALDDPSDHPWAEWARQEQLGSASPSPTRPPAAGPAAQRMPGAPSRWSGGKDLSWIPLRPDLVAEVGYDHMQGNRFRHVAHFQRWRPDRSSDTCAYAQLDRPVRFDLDDVLSGGL